MPAKGFKRWVGNKVCIFQRSSGCKIENGLQGEQEWML